MSTSPSLAQYELYADVALPVPLLQSFSYGVPTELLRARAGSRVRVRFGPRVLVGVIFDLRSEPPPLPPGTTILPLLALVDEEPVLSSEQIALARWIADYYVAPEGFVSRAMLPPQTPRQARVVYERAKEAAPSLHPRSRLAVDLLAALEKPMTAATLAKKLGKSSVTGTLNRLLKEGLVTRRHDLNTGGGARTVRVAKVTDAGRRALETEKLHPTTSRVLTLLSVATEAVPLYAIRNELDIERGGPFRRLADKGYIELRWEEFRRTPWERLAGEDPAALSLSTAQSEALTRVRAAIAAGAFSPMVLRGVTGSGKTEVYLRAAEEALSRGRTVLMLVPEIALTPRLASLLHGRFGDRVAILHSALGTGERRDEWWRIRQGAARVVVGARAAVLAPVERLGLVVVDEEHESSYKQEESPRYSARDVAIVRARNDGAVVVLGSATPSLESFTHAVEGRYELLSLPERIGRRPLAEVELIDMKGVVKDEGPDTILSSPLRDAVARRLEVGEQAMVLLNRRGYAGQLLCRQCGLALQCAECSVAMTLHRQATLAVCHYCGLGRATPPRCETCGGEYLRQVGYGTERVEEVVRASFPGSRVARMDRDTMRKKGSHEVLLSRFAARELDVLVGTQMLAKGHDFPAVTLVGVLAADSGLSVPDFRSAERTFQLLTQVAGRAGRGAQAGQVLIQTFVPDHYSLQFAMAQDYEAFYQAERKFRAALLYPPVVSLVNLVIEGASMAEAAGEARRAAGWLRRTVPEGVKVLGPAFAVRSKVAGRYRSQILVKTSKAKHAGVRAAIRAILRDDALGRSTSVDVDPMSLS